MQKIPLKKKLRRRKIGKWQKRILLALYTGLSLSLTRSPKRQSLVLCEAAYEWKKLGIKTFHRSISSLIRAKLIRETTLKDGVTKIELTQSGTRICLEYKLQTITIPVPAKWDGFWHVVMFDIPEKRKKARDAFRYHMKRLGFWELQKSVFIFPYPCAKEISFIAEFFKVRKYIRFLVVDTVDNDEKLLRKFNFLS